VQVVRYENRKKIIVAHIGSARTKQAMLSLRREAESWVEKVTKQQHLFSAQTDSIVVLNKCRYVGIRYSFIYEILTGIFTLFKFHLLNNPLLTDLVLMRIVEPASKVHSFQLLEDYFGIKRQLRDFYRQLPKFIELENAVGTKILAVAKKHFKFDFSLIFYDVTTLYFESFKSDDLRKPGFSKDNKFNQPQVIIGLVVNGQGFPVDCKMFEGNIFEGNTLLPVIINFKKKHQVRQLTVVADAAMISLKNIRVLEENNLNYIVGARLGNAPLRLIKEISFKLAMKDRATNRIKTGHGDLVCSFSNIRYRKDKYEMDKQINKAEKLVKEPSMARRVKFLKFIAPNNGILNTDLIDKTKMLLGIKGYYTNLGEEISDAVIISQYRNLWHVEQSFRVAKNDLQMRPIYHYKPNAIKAHVLICFMALAVSKFLEIKTGKSVRAVIAQLKEVTDARLFNTITKEEIVLRSEISDDLRRLIHDIGLWY